MTPASDYGEEWQASRTTAAARTAPLHEDLLALPASDLPALVDAEDQLGKQSLDRLRAVTEEGTSHGEAAVALRPDGVEGNLYLALNLAIHGLTRSSTAALLEGLPRRIQAAYGRA